MKSVIGIVVVVILAGAGFLLFKQSGTNDTQEVSKVNSNVTTEVKDIVPEAVLKTASGDDVNIKSIIAGRPAVINSWATWCPFCVNELPDFVKAHSEIGDGVEIIAVNRAESVESAEKFIDEHNARGLTYLYDSNDSWYKSIGGFSMPETLFVNKDGEVILHKRGPLSAQEVIEIIKTKLLE